jgi:hypothetical protein
MKTALRILVVILCILALYYLVVLLARGVEQESETGDEIGSAAIQREADG